ncbi:MAG: S-layer homology domain-containing protein, partial [Cyanobacteria bacterium J06642_11]
SSSDAVVAGATGAETVSEDDESVEQTPETPTSTTAEGSVIPEFTQPSYIDLGEAPAELQPYLEDLVSLNVLMLIDVKADDNIERNPNEFLPNEIINRREYARWLLAANNRFYQDQAVRKIRPAVSSSQPTFQDVGMANIDFPAIQGLAEAGIIPSPLSGTATAVKFRPDAPLTRKDLVLWKVPLDQRAALPEATTTAVTEAWGFQDSGKIEPLALKAVLADHGNGEFANIRRALGYTTLFQPDKGVTRAEAAAVLWRFGNSTEGITANQLLIEPETKTDNEAQADSSDKPNRKQQGELNENP